MSDDWNVTGSDGIVQVLSRTSVTATRKISADYFCSYYVWVRGLLLLSLDEAAGGTTWPDGLEQKVPDGSKKLPARTGKCPGELRLSARAADSCVSASREQVQDAEPKMLEVAHSAGSPQYRP
jgi:hypothetical protein